MEHGFGLVASGYVSTSSSAKSILMWKQLQVAMMSVWMQWRLQV